MQTRLLPFLRASAVGARVAAAIMMCAMTGTLASCSMPRVEGRAEAESRAAASPCETAYDAASAHMSLAFAGLSGLGTAAGADAGNADGGSEAHGPGKDANAFDDRATAPVADISRYIAADAARSDWLDVAANCSARFAEGVLRSAQASARLSELASRMQLDAADAGALTRLDGVEDSSVPPESLRTVALAEDRAGFALEVLAARGAAGATLQASDRHKTTAQQLVSLAGGDDPRAKVYEISELLAHPDVIEDPATGLAAPTAAIVELDCARQSLAPFAAPGGADGTTEDLRAIAALIANRAAAALALGYPSHDAALFTASFE